ncbi:MAG: DUF169 domain-containing protein [Actinomycetota bacterium]|nr:DUF169 domain-containing protein [Actinomycetota bacterium]
MDRIGVAIVGKKPRGMRRLGEEEKLTHCAMVARAREGETFFAEPANYKCALSRFNFGLQKRVDIFKSSVVKCLINYGHATGEEIARLALEAKPQLKEGKKYLIYFPLSERPLEPDVAIFIAPPLEMMELIHSIAKETGEVIQGCMSGVSAMCGEVTVIPIVTGRPNLSLGCCGARKFGKLKEDELLLGIPMTERYRRYGN